MCAGLRKEDMDARTKRNNTLLITSSAFHLQTKILRQQEGKKQLQQKTKEVKQQLWQSSVDNVPRDDLAQKKRKKKQSYICWFPMTSNCLFGMLQLQCAAMNGLMKTVTQFAFPTAKIVTWSLIALFRNHIYYYGRFNLDHMKGIV